MPAPGQVGKEVGAVEGGLRLSAWLVVGRRAVGGALGAPVGGLCLEGRAQGALVVCSARGWAGVVRVVGVGEDQGEQLSGGEWARHIVVGQALHGVNELEPLLVGRARRRGVLGSVQFLEERGKALQGGRLTWLVGNGRRARANKGSGVLGRQVRLELVEEVVGAAPACLVELARLCLAHLAVVVLEGARCHALQAELLGQVG